MRNQKPGLYLSRTFTRFSQQVLSNVYGFYCNIYLTQTLSFVDIGITIATQVSHFKKKGTRSNTFDIFVFLSRRTFMSSIFSNIG